MSTLIKDLTVKRGITYRVNIYLRAVDPDTIASATVQVRAHKMVPSTGAIVLELAIGTGITVSAATSPSGHAATLIACVFEHASLKELAIGQYGWGAGSIDTFGEPHTYVWGTFTVDDNAVVQ